MNADAFDVRDVDYAATDFPDLNFIVEHGDPEAALTAAARRIAITTKYTRNGCTPIECVVVAAEHVPGEDAYEVTANLQGPFALHPVMARARRGGEQVTAQDTAGFGRQLWRRAGCLPYIVLMAIAARKARRLVKWVEDRLEHLLAASSATTG